MNTNDFFSNQKKVTISIVTYNSSEEIDILMESLKSNSLFDEMTVYVIDNASKDSTVKHITEKYPWAKIINNKENLGFGKGHNLVIKNLKSEYHVIANPDIRVEKKAIKEAVDYMDRNPAIVAITPYVMNEDGTQQYLPKRNPSMKYMVGGMFENHSKTCKKWRDEYTLKNQIITEPVDVDFCTGAFMITRTEDLKKVGGFDERYFLHFEDADLTRKLKSVGRTVYNPNIKVTHKWHRDNKKISKSFWTALKSMFTYMHKWRTS